MAEPDGIARAHDPDGREALLATKLHAPPSPPDFVARPRLIERLDEGLDRGAVLVSAPAGFGKSALLADWSRRGGRSVGWLSLDPEDNDAARFWRHATAALDRACAGIVEPVAGLLGPPAPTAFTGVVTALINELTAQSSQLLLVLDDYHLIDSDDVHASVRFLLEHLPHQLRVALATRVDPPLAVARLRARGQLVELRAGDLRFSVEEATTLLRAAVGPGLPERAIATLTNRTDGWATGLQLAGLSLRNRPDVSTFVERFTGSHRYVLDYLTEEVLEQQPEQLRSFLLDTAILRRLSGGLCDAVTGRSDGQAMLEAIERANLFLTPLDDLRHWWRYHPLFADMLRARLQRASPGRAPELHRAAAAWHQQHGSPDDAVHHALGAGDAEWAARIIERHVDEVLFRAEKTTVRRWFTLLPDDVVSDRPRLLLAQTRLALLADHTDAAAELLDAAEHAWQDGPDADDDPFEPSAGRAASLLANVPATIALDRAYLAELRGDAQAAVAFATAAKDHIDPDEWMLASHADGYLALAKMLHGRVDEAAQLLSSTIATWRAAGEHDLAIRGYHHLGQVQRARGDLDAADATYRQALQGVMTPGRSPPPVAGMAHVGLAEIAYQRNELESALAHLTDGIPLCRQLAYTPPLATGLATLAWIRHATGDADGALDAMDEAEQVSAQPDVTHLLSPVRAQHARLLLVHGDVTTAARWAEQQDLQPQDLSYALEPAHLVLARVRLAQGHPEQALALLERLLDAATAQQRRGSVIELRALQALAQAATGDDASAVSTIAETLLLACPRGYVRVFTDEGAAMARLLRRLIAAQSSDATAASDVPFDCLARLQESFTTTPAPDRVDRVDTGHGLVDPLTDRELEVLQLVATGSTNADVAEQLVVTLDTVKKHVSHILDKLGATNRTEAVARARKLGLIPST